VHNREVEPPAGFLAGAGVASDHSHRIAGLDELLGRNREVRDATIGGPKTFRATASLPDGARRMASPRPRTTRHPRPNAPSAAGTSPRVKAS
jgi:hypothetical protein